MTEFISRKYGNDGYEIIIKTDSHEHYKAAKGFARRMIDHEKPMTNGDRIRAMNDEELVKFIEDTQIAGCPDPARSCRASCKDCIMDWLKQPAEVDHESET